MAEPLALPIEQINYQPPLLCSVADLLAQLRDRFASSILTPREKQLVDLMLQSYRLDGCSAKLGVSIETLRVHRRNIYRKLDIHSHLELFSLFFACVDGFEPGSDKDPLLYLDLSSAEIMKKQGRPDFDIDL